MQKLALLGQYALRLYYPRPGLASTGLPVTAFTLIVEPDRGRCGGRDRITGETASEEIRLAPLEANSL